MDNAWGWRVGSLGFGIGIGIVIGYKIRHRI